jgi:hypothetical protein
MKAWKRYRPVALILNMYFGTMAVLHLAVDITADAATVNGFYNFDNNEACPSFILPRPAT